MGRYVVMRSQENGIPEGSVIAPTLFLICMQSLLKNIPPNVHILVYADDIVILSFHNFKSIARKRMQFAVNFVSEWADHHGRPWNQPSPKIDLSLL